MKLSLSWIFDHIKESWRDYDVQELIQKFNGTTAEIEKATPISIEWDDFTLARVLSVGSQDVVIESVEWKKKVSLPVRKDAVVGQWYLLKKENKDLRWATLIDLHAEKDGLVAVVACSELDQYGAWREKLVANDYIFEIDNKSITNRPDLWCHRGVAREIAAILGCTLLPEDRFLVEKPIQHYAHRTDAQASSSPSLAVAIDTTTFCSRLAVIPVNAVTAGPSLLWMVARLASVDARPLNALVDMTNYVMYDFGHPMHAFDAKKITGNAIVARQAHRGEKLLLLDDTTIELTEHDCVIADAKNNTVLSLAGIMGGRASSVQLQTTELVLEAAHFDATAIRLSAAGHKKRTESSQRFEKSLDPNGNTLALQRYFKLLNDAGITYQANSAIISIGALAQEKVITIEHQFIVNRLGAPILPEQVERILKNLGFGVQSKELEKGAVYTVTVPTFRSSKDVTIKEDILEEIGRFFGYENIHPALPLRMMTPTDASDNARVYQRWNIKNHCAFALHMKEVVNYALYDESFIQQIGLLPTDAPVLKNPLSHHWQRLVTSLVPHLIKNIAQNSVHHDTLRFFEWNCIWHQEDAETIREQRACTGIMYDKLAKNNFYDGKEQLQSLFDMLALLVIWRKPQGTIPACMDRVQIAELVAGERVIGYAGMVNANILHKVAAGSAFAFELFISELEQVTPLQYGYHEVSKYQAVMLDISMLAPYAVTLSQLEECIASVDARINDVYLVDLFEKAEWADRRSITVRYVVQDSDKTLTGQEIEAVQKSVHEAVKKQGVEIR